MVLQPIDVVLNSDGMSRGYLCHVKKYAFYGCCSVTAIVYIMIILVERMKGISIIKIMCVSDLRLAKHD